MDYFAGMMGKDFSALKNNLTVIIKKFWPLRTL